MRERSVVRIGVAAMFAVVLELEKKEASTTLAVLTEDVERGAHHLRARRALPEFQTLLPKGVQDGVLQSKQGISV